MKIKTKNPIQFRQVKGLGWMVVRVEPGWSAYWRGEQAGENIHGLLCLQWTAIATQGKWFETRDEARAAWMANLLTT